MEPRDIRKEAIRRHLMGEGVTAICRDLNVSRKWFYKWHGRYKTEADGWYNDQSRAPKSRPHKTERDVEQLVLRVRDKLAQTKYAQIGAMAIAWQIQELGGRPLPLWTINRILKRNDRIKPPAGRTRNKSGVSYPYFVDAWYPGHIHQADLLGPRYLKGHGRLYCLSAVDRFSHLASCVSLRSKDDDSVVCALTETWRQIGVPDILQLDNELSFLGSNRYPHSLGKVLKLCLALGIQPVFIPQGEPWRNGVVEHFNRTFEHSFYRTEQFESFDHLRQQLRTFLIFHNDNHVYSANRGKTPRQVIKASDIQPVKLSPDFVFSLDQTLPYESYIHFIRLIRNDLKLKIRGEAFPMPREAMYQYVRATIYTEYHQLNVFLDDKLIESFHYPLPNFNQEEPNMLIQDHRRFVGRQ